MSRSATIIKGLAALAVVAALAAGVPWALWHFVGWPLPHRLPAWNQLSASLSQHGIADTTLLKALACVVWLAWAVLIASLVVEIPAAIRGRAAAHFALAGPLQPMVAQLLAAIAIAALSLTPRPPNSGPQPLASALAPRTARPLPAIALVADASSTATTTSRVEAAPPPQATPADSPLRSYVVARNDTLWGIAERELGDPLRWRDIYTLNQDRPQPGGARLVDPHWIDPGWTLLLPGGIQTTSPPEVATPPPGHAPSPSTVARRAPATTSPTEPDPAWTSTQPALPAPSSPDVEPARPPAATANPGPVSLPSGSLVAGSFAAGVVSAVALGRLRRRHGYQPGPPEPGRSLAPPPLGPTIRRLAAGLATPDADDPPQIPEPESALDVQHGVPSDQIEIGERNSATVTANLADLSGAALCGEAAHEVGRAWTTALLTRAGPLGAEVVAPAATIGRLFPAVGEVPGLRTVKDNAQLVRLLEAEVVTRTRQILASGNADAAAYRHDHPDQPLPTVLALADQLAPAEAARLAPTLKASRRLGIAVVFLSEVTDAPIRLRLHGRLVIAAEPADKAGHLPGTRLYGLQAGEAVDVLHALTDAEFRPTSDDNPEWTEVIERMEHPPPEPETWPDQPAPGIDAASTPVRVRALGPLAVTVSGQTISRGLRSVAKELLVYYLLRPEGATVEEAVDHLWPDTDPKLVHRQFWIAASNLRTHLRTGAATEAKVLDQIGDVYRLDPAVISADLWDFQTALAEAARAVDDTTTTEALRRAVDAYEDDLATGVAWMWVEPPREDLHRRALNACLRLAELEQAAGNPAAAEATLERAVDVDRYGEEPYRRLMALQAARGRADAVKATWRALQRRLAEIDLDPDPASIRLYRRLVGTDVEQRVADQ